MNCSMKGRATRNAPSFLVKADCIEAYSYMANLNASEVSFGYWTYIVRLNTQNRLLLK